VVVWEGEAVAHGATPVRAELLRVERGAVRVVWRWPAEPDGEVVARRWTVRLPEIRVRYELRYPGWVPGCDGQTEQEDVFRYSPGRHTFRLVGRRIHHRWHRELHAALGRVLTALQQRDARALAALVPDRRLRATLPAGLEREAACDEADGTRPSVVSVAVMRSPERAPWVLGFRRTGPTWRLVAARPVIE
jgi:hypothetical protein